MQGWLIFVVCVGPNSIIQTILYKIIFLGSIMFPMILKSYNTSTMFRKRISPATEQLFHGNSDGWDEGYE
jgi:hypothetical protein